MNWLLLTLFALDAGRPAGARDAGEAGLQTVQLFDLAQGIPIPHPIFLLS
jgi:hypothetical protein